MASWSRSLPTSYISRAWPRRWLASLDADLHDILHKWQTNDVLATTLMESYCCCLIAVHHHVPFFIPELVVYTLTHSVQVVTLLCLGNIKGDFFFTRLHMIHPVSLWKKYTLVEITCRVPNTLVESMVYQPSDVASLVISFADDIRQRVETCLLFDLFMEFFLGPSLP